MNINWPDIDWSNVAAVYLVIGVIVADLRITRRGGRYARAVYDLLMALASTVVMLAYIFLTVLDAKVDLTWWNNGLAWWEVFVVGLGFPLLLMFTGHALPRKIAAYRRERDVRSGKLVRTVETRDGVTYETVEPAAVAARRNRVRDGLALRKD